MVNFYNRFLPKCSLFLQPLYTIFKSCKRGQSVALVLTSEADNAYDAAKQALRAVTTLCFPSQDAPTSIITNTSNTGTGAVLQQYKLGRWKPLTFFSEILYNAN